MCRRSRSKCRCGNGTFLTAPPSRSRDLMREHKFTWHGKLQRIRLDPADLPFAHLAHRTSSRRLTMDARSVTSRRRSAADQLWYKDAIIYQLHVKSFFDSNDDGIGDFPGLDLQARLHRRSRRQRDMAVAVLSLAAARRRLRHQRLSRRSSRLRHARRFPPFRPRGACPRYSRHHRTCDQSHLRPASAGFSVPAAPSRDRPGATSTSGPTTIKNTPARASSSSTPSARTGPGIRLPAPITGIASTRTSPI